MHHTRLGDAAEAVEGVGAEDADEDGRRTPRRHQARVARVRLGRADDVEHKHAQHLQNAVERADLPSTHQRGQTREA